MCAVNVSKGSRRTGFFENSFFLKPMETLHCPEIQKVLFVFGRVKVIVWMPPVACFRFSPGNMCLLVARAHCLAAWDEWQQSYKMVSDPQPRFVVPSSQAVLSLSFMIPTFSYPHVLTARVRVLTVGWSGGGGNERGFHSVILSLFKGQILVISCMCSVLLCRTSAPHREGQARGYFQTPLSHCSCNRSDTDFIQLHPSGWALDFFFITAPRCPSDALIRFPYQTEYLITCHHLS